MRLYFHLKKSNSVLAAESTSTRIFRNPKARLPFLDRVPESHPLAPPSSQRVHVPVPHPDQQERHPGARPLLVSGTVQDDRLVRGVLFRPLGVRRKSVV